MATNFLIKYCFAKCLAFFLVGPLVLLNAVKNGRFSWSWLSNPSWACTVALNWAWVSYMVPQCNPRDIVLILVKILWSEDLREGRLQLGYWNLILLIFPLPLHSFLVCPLDNLFLSLTIDCEYIIGLNHGTALHCTALHCTALHCTALN